MPRLRRPEAEGVLTMPDRLAEIQLPHRRDDETIYDVSKECA